MTENEQRRARISALLAEIEATQKALGPAFSQPSDREAYDTVCRIQRRVQAHLSEAAE